MEPKVIPFKIGTEDTQAVIAAYKQHLAGKPAEELNLDSWQREVFSAISRGVASGKSGSQISMETGYNATLCCDFRKIKQHFHRDLKASKNHSTKTGKDAITRLQTEYGMKVATPKQKSIFEVLQMALNREKISHVKGISDLTVHKVRKFQEMYKKGASVPEIALTTGICENEVRKMFRMKKEKEQLSKML
ncbi:hypothetical protein EQO05_00980 [Methanosarcina sp. MSH10X1]|uniref:hypothetical protein n=1 Tax=Methanosarcina sp. MSH10X1 TaxID=2507075 RepID=UPI000FFC4AF7|nr:hypothetical protein [Methanosarcina sp. MSH10X1]RXA21842.1 hypothetical protein EQO05_00980 [Methanosarcina sp. MSH10X1]